MVNASTTEAPSARLIIAAMLFELVLRTFSLAVALFRFGVGERKPIAVRPMPIMSTVQ